MSNLKKIQEKVENLINNPIEYSFGTVCLKDKGWYFKGFDRATKRAGVCVFAFKNFQMNKYISLSRVLMNAFTYEEAINTLTHEIAHAIDFEYRGKSNHDLVWKRIHNSIGGTGERCYKANESVKEIQKRTYNYIGVCKKCGKEVNGWIRKPKYYGVENIYIHKGCGGYVEIKEKYIKP